MLNYKFKILNRTDSIPKGYSYFPLFMSRRDIFWGRTQLKKALRSIRTFCATIRASTMRAYGTPCQLMNYFSTRKLFLRNRGHHTLLSNTHILYAYTFHLKNNSPSILGLLFLPVQTSDSYSARPARWRLSTNCRWHCALPVYCHFFPAE
jgi:hypothetical protein